MNLREIHMTDAEAYLQLLRRVEAESPYALLEPGERNTSIREQQDEITHILARENQAIFVVEDGPTLVGWIGAFGEPYRRVSHSVLVGVGILAEYQQLGIGTWLFEALEKWARHQRIHRLELLVQTGNKAGIALYQKMGFQIEGTKRESYVLNGAYVDEYLMAKIITPPAPPPPNRYPRW